MTRELTRRMRAPGGMTHLFQLATEDHPLDYSLCGVGRTDEWRRTNVRLPSCPVCDRLAKVWRSVKSRR